MKAPIGWGDDGHRGSSDHAALLGGVGIDDEFRRVFWKQMDERNAFGAGSPDGPGTFVRFPRYGGQHSAPIDRRRFGKFGQGAGSWDAGRLEGYLPSGQPQLEHLVLASEHGPMCHHPKTGIAAEIRERRAREIIAVFVKDVPKTMVLDDPLKQGCFEDHDWISCGSGEGVQFLKKRSNGADMLNDMATDQEVVRLGNIRSGHIPAMKFDVAARRTGIAFKCGVVTDTARSGLFAEPSEEIPFAAAHLQDAFAAECVPMVEGSRQVLKMVLKGGREALPILVIGIVRNHRVVEVGVEHQTARSALDKLDVSTGDGFRFRRGSKPVV